MQEDAQASALPRCTNIGLDPMHSLGLPIMDELVRAALAKWPNVPDVYGWLSLDARGQWLLRGTPIGHAPTRAFIDRNYACTPEGCWYFQNGPQRVFVDLHATPYIACLDAQAAGWTTHNGIRIERIDGWLQDEQDGLVLLTELGPALVLDRDLGAAVECLPLNAAQIERCARAELAKRFGFQTRPRPDNGDTSDPCVA